MKNANLTILHYIHGHIMYIFNNKCQKMYKKSISLYFVSKSVMITSLEIHESMNPSFQASCVELRFHVRKTLLKQSI